MVSNEFINRYKEVAYDMLRVHFPDLTGDEVQYVLDEMVEARVKDTPVNIDNNYKKTITDTTLLTIADYILTRRPITTPYGVLYTRHETMRNPIHNMLSSFILGRKAAKKEMFKHPKGSAEFTKMNLVQLLLKLDANAYYGASGMYTSLYYNLYAAASVTSMGRSCISAAALLFESVLANNVPFGSLNEVIVFIHNVMIDVDKEYDIKFGIHPKMDDTMYIDHVPSLEETFYKVMVSCGFEYIPDDDDLNIIWDIMTQLDQKTLTRLYYKNNLYEFCDNIAVKNLLVIMLQKLDKPFVDPNEVPEAIETEMTLFKDLIFEYVYYHHQIIDRLDKMEALVRDVSIIQDTDSSIVSFDAWFNYISEATNGIPMTIKTIKYDEVDDEVVGYTKPVDYDFLTDEIVELKRATNPIVMIPQDGLRHSIISILGNTIGFLINDFMVRYCDNANALLPESKSPGAPCLMIMKNEFLFKRLLITDAKKHYASKVELQEGKHVPPEKSLDVKGMDAFTKSTTSDFTRNRMKKILYEDILNTPVIDQINVVKQLAIFEKEIYDSIQAGEKKYYKPAKVKSFRAYDNPMRIQGIKACLAFNELKEDGTEAIDMTIRNSVDIAKIEITPKNVYKIADEFPGVHDRAVHFMATNEYFKSGIDSIAIPLNEPVPKWVLPFIRYSEIINANVGNFPLESIGLHRGNPSNNSTNIVSF